MFARDNKPNICLLYQLDKSLYKAILDLNITEYHRKDGTKKSKMNFRCEIGCLVYNINKIHVVDILDNDCHIFDEGSKSIAFIDKGLYNDLDNVNLKISQDFSKVMLSYKTENYMIRIDRLNHGGLFIQDKVKYLDKK